MGGRRKKKGYPLSRVSLSPGQLEKLACGLLEGNLPTCQLPLKLRRTIDFSRIIRVKKRFSTIKRVWVFPACTCTPGSLDQGSESYRWTPGADGWSWRSEILMIREPNYTEGETRLGLFFICEFRIGTDWKVLLDWWFNRWVNWLKTELH